MMEDIQDPLKSLSSVHEPDPRHTHFVLKLPHLHAVLSGIVLADHVPLNVRQLFETAKNVSLYSWFVYRFHQVAELVAYSALEMALKERAGFVELAGPNTQRARGLKRLLEKSKKEGWLKGELFPSFRMLATERARHAQVTFAISAEVETMAIAEPTEDEIQAAMREIDIVQILIDRVPWIRNELAHGSSTLSPTSMHTELPPYFRTPWIGEIVYPEVFYEEANIHSRVQARGGPHGQRSGIGEVAGSA